jgi:uncharacterized repeat protein (TIGR01451 family)
MKLHYTHLRTSLCSLTTRRLRYSALAGCSLLLLVLAVYYIASPPTAQSVSTNIVISQVYGGAGCGTAGCSTYKNDYIELFNRSASAVSVNGWSVQYAAATGTSWQVTNLPNVSIPAGGYLLVEESFNANGVNNLPTPDVTGTIFMSATAAKVALVNTTTALSGACPTGANIIDFVGYGTAANCNEGGANAPAPSTTTADIRAGGGCTDTDNNSADFAAGAPNPRNSATALAPCGGGNAPISPNCPASLTTTVGTATSSGVSATDADGTVTSATITGITPSNPGTITLTGFTPAGGVGGTANATLNVSNTTPVGSYNVTIQWANNDGVPQTANCVVAVNVTAIVFIHDVQGNGAATPIPGATVTIEGVVTGDFQPITNDNRLSGFFVQEENTDFDADPLTSEGIFVFCSACPTNVAEGQKVRVTGTVSEFNNLTEITATTAGSVVITNAGNNLAQVSASTIDLPVVGVIDDFYETMESMLVTFVDTLTVSEYFEQARYGRIELYEGTRPRAFNESNPPSVAGFAAHNDNLNRRRVYLDDDDNVENSVLNLPDGQQFVFHPQANGGLSIGTQGTDFFRGGDTISSLTGILHFSFSGGTSPNEWRVRPVAASPATFTAVNVRPPTPPAVGGAIRAASVNVLNYFTTLNVRGADSTAELNRQRERTSIVLCSLNPDVAALMEIENHATNATITDLLGAVNTRCGGTHPYTFVNTGGALGTDEIRVLLIYRTGVLSPVGAPLSDLDPVHNRPPTAQTFDVVDALNPAFGKRFTALANHSKSKGCGGASGADLDQNDGQGCFAATRLAQANRLITWVNGTVIPAAGDPDVLMLGDFNAYPQETSAAAITGAGFSDLETAFLGSAAYSYLFGGQIGHIDYAWSSASLTPQVTGVAPWHINADENPLFDYNDEIKDGAAEQTFEEKPDGSALVPPRVLFQPASPYRASDHDPVLVGLFQVADLSITKVEGADPVTAGTNLTYTITVTNSGPDAASTVSWSDTLPMGTTFVSLPDVAGWLCSKPMVGASGMITCSNPSFAVGSAVFTLTVAVDASGAAGTMLSNDVTATSPTTDPDTNDRMANETTTVVYPTPTVSITATDATADENTVGDTATFTLTRTGPTTSALTVQLSQTLTGASAADFSLAAGTGGSFSGMDLTFTFNAGSATGTLVLTAVNDVPAEADELVQLSVVDAASYDPGSPSSATATIVRNDFVVTNTNDSGEGSLRQASDNANNIAGANTITFAGSVFTDATPDTITLTSGQLRLTETGAGNGTTITGPTAAGLTISGNDTSRVFRVDSSVVAAISDLTVSGGRETEGFGAGIRNHGNLTLTRVTVSGNTSSAAGGAGGITSSGTLTLIDSTVRNNSGTGDAAAGGIFSTGTAGLTNSTVSGNTNTFAAGVGGIVQSGGMLTLTNSTVSGNRTNDAGGGVLVSANGTANLLNSTITDNHADNGNSGGTGKNGGGIKVVLGVVTLQNTIVAGNYRGSGTTTADDIRGNVTANFSFIGDTTNATITGGNNLNGNPLLAALANNGGPTQTHALLPGSPAINAGTSSGAPTTDQRGSSRVGAPDIGAFESQGFTLMIASGNNQSTPVNINFANPLKVNVTASNVNEPVNGGLVTFTPPGSGASANIAGTPATVTSGMATSGTVTANGTAGTYNVAASAKGATSVNFTLTNLPLPTIIAQAGVSRQQGSSSTNSQIATASDTVDPVNTLQISVSSDGTNFGNSATLNGVTFTLTDSNAGAGGSNPDATGKVFANVNATCTASNASFTLKVTGSSNRMAIALLSVVVTANTPPTLSYANQAVAVGGSINVSPTTAADNGSITGYSIVSVVPPLNVAPTVNSSGVVMITNANPAGSHTITVRATDNCNAPSEASFTLNVTASVGNLLSGSINDPLTCTGPGNAVVGTIQLNNPAAIAQTFTLTTTFTNYVGVPGSCTLTGAAASPTPSCTVTASGLMASGSLPANTTLTVQYQAQVATVPPGTVLTASNVATLGGAPVSPNPLVFTTTVNCPAVGPGLLIADTAPVNDQKPSSVLVYNLYSSSSAAPNAQNTRISITNTHPSLPIAVHLFFVDGATCSIADSLICLTPQQTASFLASDIDPGTTGYIVAVASDETTGCPINFNYLIGDAAVKLSSGHAAGLAAEGFAAIAGGLPACDASSVTTILNFDGTSYNRVPRVLAASNIPSRGDGNDILLVLNRIGGSLVTGAATLTNLFGILYDDAENPLSFNFSPNVCQFRSSLSNNFPRVAPRFDQFIPAGRSGWGKFYATGELGLLGAQINFNPNAGTAANAFNQGHNLHKLTLTQSVQLTIPIFPPNC